MAHYAQLDENNVVTTVIVADQEFIDSGAVGDPQKWLQTSYNTINGVHVSGGRPFRGNFASKGYTYDPNIDAFLPPKPFPSWTLNPATFSYEPPVPRPSVPLPARWDETSQAWQIIPKVAHE